MWKKISIALSMGLLGSTVHAESSFKSGFVVGAHFGITHGRASKEKEIFHPQFGLISNAQTTSKSHDTKPMGGILGGYQYVFANNWTVGGDVALNYMSNQNLSSSVLLIQIPFRDEVRRKYNAIASLNFGRVFYQRYHIYVGLGLGVSRFEHRVYDLGEPSLVKKHRTKVAFVPSIGIDYALGQHWMVSANVAYEFYQKINQTYGSDLLGSLQTSAYYKSQIKPEYLVARFGVKYKF